MKIKMSDLKILSEKILTKAENSGYLEIDIHLDLYWAIPFEEMCKLDIGNRGPGIGSFVDDWESLKNFYTNEYPVSSNDLERLGNILRIIGKEMYEAKQLSRNKNKEKLIIISLSDLKLLCDMIFIKTEMSGFKEIDTDIDHYLNIRLSGIHDLYIEKPEIIKGSFKDDWNNLKIAVSSDHSIESTDFDNLGNVIKIIANEIHKKKAAYIRMCKK